MSLVLNNDSYKKINLVLCKQVCWNIFKLESWKNCIKQTVNHQETCSFKIKAAKHDLNLAHIYWNLTFEHDISTQSGFVGCYESENVMVSTMKRT